MLRYVFNLTLEEKVIAFYRYRLFETWPFIASYIYKLKRKAWSRLYKNDTSRFEFSYDASYLWRDIASDSYRYSFRLMEGVIASDKYRPGNVRTVINCKSYRIDITRTT
jgi:hypothetical protein